MPNRHDADDEDDDLLEGAFWSASGFHLGGATF